MTFPIKGNFYIDQRNISIENKVISKQDYKKNIYFFL